MRHRFPLVMEILLAVKRDQRVTGRANGATCWQETAAQGRSYSRKVRDDGTWFSHIDNCRQLSIHDLRVPEKGDLD